MKKHFFLTLFVLLLCLACSGCGETCEMLPEPQNLAIHRRVVTWDPVENASGYLVSFLQEEYHIDECSFDLHYLLDAGDYRITVVALGDGEEYSNSVITSLEFSLERPLESGSDEKGFRYTFLDDLMGYEVSATVDALQGDVVIPDYFGDYPVKKIAKHFARPWGGMVDIVSEANCNRITTGIQLPAYLESIDLYGLAYMVNVTEIVIPDTVTEISTAAFSGCKRLRKAVLPKGLKAISVDCFADTGLAELELPNTLEVIGERAFRCDEYTGNVGEPWRVYSALDSIVIPDSVKEIGLAAFAGRENLKEITVPQNLEWMDRSVFLNTLWYESQPEGLVYLGNVLYAYKGEMPENYELEVSADVYGIAGGAFYFQRNLEKARIADGVKLLGTRTFNSCLSLSEVILPADLDKIPEATFGGTDSLKRISIPDTVTEIGRSAFAGSALACVEIPSGVRTIGSGAFINCTALKEIVLPEGLASIGGGAFYGCAALETACLPASLKEVGAYPFSECDSLTHVFYGGNSLAQLTLRISGVDDIEKAVESYRSAPIYYYSETEPAEEGNYWHYVDGKPTVWE